jgi:hypothetical protein
VVGTGERERARVGVNANAGACGWQYMEADSWPGNRRSRGFGQDSSFVDLMTTDQFRNRDHRKHENLGLWRSHLNPITTAVIEIYIAVALSPHHVILGAACGHPNMEL